MENFSIGFDRETAIPAISDCNAAFFSRANVVIGCVEPLIGMFVESRDEGRLFGSVLRIKFVAPLE